MIDLVGPRGYTVGMWDTKISLCAALILVWALAAPAQVVIVGRQVIVKQAQEAQQVDEAEQMGVELARRTLRKYAGQEVAGIDRQAVRALIRQLGHRDWNKRQAATEKLLQLGTAVQDHLERALEDKDPEIKARARHILDQLKQRTPHLGADLRMASMILARAGGREAPGFLIRALDDPRLPVRRAAAGSLRRITGRDMGYWAHDEQDKRQAAVKRWQNWWDKAEANYRYDASKESAVLVCNPPKRGVMAIDLDGNLLWRRQFDDVPSCVWPKEGGNLLVAFRHESEILEYDRKGEVVWRSGDKAGIEGAFDMQRLDNGNLLITDDPGGKVVEIDRKGQVVWQVENLDHPHAAWRTQDGKTLISVHKADEVIEVSREGKVLRRLENQHSVSDGRGFRKGRYMCITRMGNKPQLALVNFDGEEVGLYQAGWPITSGMITPEGIIFSATQGDGVVRGFIEGRVGRTGIARPDMWGKIRVAPRGLIEAAAPAK
jgi:hypothetical protein